MSYQLNKTDGELLVELADGQIDNTTTDITLVGRNYKGFGESFNENFIRIIENFANAAAPSNPLVGQLWYDKAEQRLKLYDGTTFRTAGGPIVSSSEPQMVAGDIWIDNENNKMYFYDGTDLVLVGPDYDASQGQTGLEVQSSVDISGRERVLLKMYIGGTLYGVFSKEEFRLASDNKIAGFPDDENDTILPRRQLFLKGFNPVDQSFWYQGTSARTRSLVDAQGNAFTSNDFVPTTGPGEMSGSLVIRDPDGVAVGEGDAQFAIFKVFGSLSMIEVQQKNQPFAVRVRDNQGFVNALYINTVQKMGIWNNNPQYDLDLTGNFRATGNAIIDGNLTVNGDTVFVNSSTLQIEDKNIELARSTDGFGTDVDADQGGLILKSSEGDKTWLYDDAKTAWSSNQNINLGNGQELLYNGNALLSNTTIGSSVTTAQGLTNIGTLVELQVDNINLDGSTITTSTGGLTINPTGDITVTNSKIKDVLDPTLAQDAATKNYVDTTVGSEPVVFALDITGLSDPDATTPYISVATIITELFPPANKQDGTYAYIHCTSYQNAQVTNIDIASAMSKEFISVLSDDSSSQSVVQDVNFSPASGDANFTPTRQTMTFRVTGGAWVYQP